MVEGFRLNGRLTRKSIGNFLERPDERLGVEVEAKKEGARGHGKHVMERAAVTIGVMQADARDLIGPAFP
jgi:hypothetical protein